MTSRNFTCSHSSHTTIQPATLESPNTGPMHESRSLRGRALHKLASLSALSPSSTRNTSDFAKLYSACPQPRTALNGTSNGPPSGLSATGRVPMVGCLLASLRPALTLYSRTYESSKSYLLYVKRHRWSTTYSTPSASSTKSLLTCPRVATKRLPRLRSSTR